MSNVTLDIHGIIDFCCGTEKPADMTYTKKKILLAKRFTQAGRQEIKPDSIQKWLERGQIPGDRMIDLLFVARRVHKRLDYNKFLLTPVDKAKKSLFG